MILIKFVTFYFAGFGKPSDFDFKMLNERNAFLAGRMNAAFERPISATHSKFNGIVPEGKLIDKVEKDIFIWCSVMSRQDSSELP